MYIILFILCWFIIGFIQAGYAYSYFQREWPGLAEKDRTQDLMISLVGGLTGPCSIPASVIQGHYKYPWTFPGSKW